jgi:hypothetical protein
MAHHRKGDGIVGLVGVSQVVGNFRKYGWTPADSSGLVGLWIPSGVSGQVWQDGWGANDLQLGSSSGADSNDPAFAAGPPSSVDFDGDDFCYDPDSNQAGSPLNIAGDITIFATVYLNQGSPLDATQSVIARTRGSGGAVYNYELRFANFTPDRTQFLWGDGLTLQHFYRSGDVIPDATWFTICATGRWGAQNNQYIYENGNSTPIASATIANAPTVEDSAFTVLGAAPRDSVPSVFDSYLTGGFGPVLIYNEYKTAAQIRNLHDEIDAEFPDYGLPAGV